MDICRLYSLYNRIKSSKLLLKLGEPSWEISGQGGGNRQWNERCLFLLFYNYFLFYPNRKTPTSTSGSDPPYSASVGVESDFAAKSSFWDVLEAFVTEDSMFNFS